LTFEVIYSLSDALAGLLFCANANQKSFPKLLSWFCAKIEPPLKSKNKNKIKLTLPKWLVLIILCLVSACIMNIGLYRLRKSTLNYLQIVDNLRRDFYISFVFIGISFRNGAFYLFFVSE
jgi:hypothetical protein